MSDEFIKLATEEINEELASLSKIFDSCSKDSDISDNGNSIGGHIHKIKGLAPMMGKKQVGEIASLNDALIKRIIAGNQINGIYEILSESNDFMKKAMVSSELDVDVLKQKIHSTFSEFLN